MLNALGKIAVGLCWLLLGAGIVGLIQEWRGLELRLFEEADSQHLANWTMVAVGLMGLAIRGMWH